MGYPTSAMALNSEKLEKLLRHAKVTQQSIQAVSTWILDRRAFLGEIVEIWERLVREGEPAHQIVYLYIANDTMQVGVRKFGKHIAELFEAKMLGVVEYVMNECDEKVKRCMIKIIGIWKERKTVTPPLLEMLENVCAGKPAAPEKSESEMLSIDEKVRATQEALYKELETTEAQEAVLVDMPEVQESEATATTDRCLQEVVSATISADLLSDRMFQLESSLSTFHHAIEAFTTGAGVPDESKEEDEEEQTSAGDIVWRMLDQQVFEVDVERSREHVHQYRANLETQNAKRDDLVNHLESLKLLDPFQEPIFHTSRLLRDQQTEALERLYSVCLKAEIIDNQRQAERQAAYHSRPPLAPMGVSPRLGNHDAYRISAPSPQSSYSSHNDYYRSSDPMDSFPQAPPPRGHGHRRFSSMDAHDHSYRDDNRYGNGADDAGYNKRPKLQHSQSLDDSRRPRPSRWDQSPRGGPYQDHNNGGYGYGDRFQGGGGRGGYDRGSPSPRHNRSPRWDDRRDDQARRW